MPTVPQILVGTHRLKREFHVDYGKRYEHCVRWRCCTLREFFLPAQLAPRTLHLEYFRVSQVSTVWQSLRFGPAVHSIRWIGFFPVCFHFDQPV